MKLLPWWCFASGTLGGCLLVLVLTRSPAVTPGVAVGAGNVAPATGPTAWSLETPPDGPGRDALIAAWLALDPAATSLAERAVGLRALLVIADADQLAALADRLARRGGEDDARWFERVFARWVELAPAAATRWTARIGDAHRLPPELFTRLRAQAALAWAGQDFDPAYAWALAQPDADAPTGVTARLLGWLAERDPARALALAEARGPAVGAAALRPIFDTWVKRDPVGALRALGPRLLATGATGFDLADPLRAWLHHSPDEALAWMGEQPRLAEWRTDSLSFARVLASHRDRLTSLAAVMRVGDPELRHQLLRGMLVVSWPDGEEAAGLLDKLDDPGLRARLLRDSTRITFGDIRRNLPVALLLPPGGERDARLIELTSTWARTDPLAALEWLGKNDESAVAAAVQAAALGAIAADEPETALAHWATLPAGPVRDQAVDEIVRGWAPHDPARAAAWLTARDAERDTDRETRWATLRPLMHAWVPTDEPAALAWAEARFATAADHTALHLWANELSQRLPALQAAERIAVVGDEPMRRQLLNTHLHRWLRTDLLAAETWLRTQTHIAPDRARAMVEEARRENSR